MRETIAAKYLKNIIQIGSYEADSVVSLTTTPK